MWWQLQAPDRVIFSWGEWLVYWYGLIFSVAILVAFFLLKKIIKNNYLRDSLEKLLVPLVFFGLIGARLFEVLFYNFEYFSQNPGEIFKIWQGGLSIFGGIIAGAMVVVVYFWPQKKTLGEFLGYLGLAMPLAQALGRWGNYFNQELFGPPCQNFWCIYIEPVLRPEQYFWATTFFPSFFLESVLCLALFIALFTWFRKNSQVIFQIPGAYLIGYGLIRFITEFFRVDVTANFIGLKWPQLLSLLFVLVGWLMVRFDKSRLSDRLVANK